MAVTPSDGSTTFLTRIRVKDGRILANVLSWDRPQRSAACRALDPDTAR